MSNEPRYANWGALPGRLLVLSGPSGVGKSTLVRRLYEHPEIRVRPSVSATTRAPRAGERPGIDYYFFARDEFLSARDRGEFLETAEVHGHLYGTPAGPVETLLAQGLCVALVIDVQGGLQVKEKVPGAVLAFVHAPDLAILEARLRARGTDDEATIRRRLDNARREIEVANHHYEIHVINEDLDEAVGVLAGLVQRLGCGG